MTDPEFEHRIRTGLHRYADQVQPRGTLAQLLDRIHTWRLFHRRPRRLVRAARAVDPDTQLMAPVPPVLLAAPRRAPGITCPRCGFTSHHPDDIEQGYCGNCHDWTSPRALVAVCPSCFRPRGGTCRCWWNRVAQ